MRRILLTAILLLGGTGGVWAEVVDAPIDVLAFSNGALIERSSPSLGEQRPVAPNDTALGCAQNRRVEVAK